MANAGPHFVFDPLVLADDVGCAQSALDAEFRHIWEYMPLMSYARCRVAGMGCGCGGGKKSLPTVAPERWASLVDKTYRNDSEEILESRNPRLEIKPGNTITLNSETINHSIRAWIRTGVLVLVPEAPEAAAKKPAAKKSAAKASTKK